VIAPTVSAVVVAHDSAGDLAACLRSLDAPDGVLEVIVVDNASRDDSAAAARAAAPGARVLRSEVNLGFAGGANLGLAAARGRWVLLLNPDAALAPGALDALVAAGEARPEAGLLAPKVIRPDGRIDTVGHLLAPCGLNAGRGAGTTDDGRLDPPAEIAFPSGAAMLVRRRVVEEAGGFVADWFAYGDEADLGLRARRLGWRAFAAPAAVAHHRGSPPTARKAYLVERNRQWVLAAHLPLLPGMADAVLRHVVHAGQALTGRGALGAVGRRALAGALLAAWRDGLAGTPRALARRRSLRGDTAGVAALARRHRLPLRRTPS
jgi:GT2 family glycosyltransferase